MIEFVYIVECEELIMPVSGSHWVKRIESIWTDSAKANARVDKLLAIGEKEKWLYLKNPRWFGFKVSHEPY